MLKVRNLKDSSAFADINFRLCVKLNGKFHCLNEVTDLMNLVEQIDTATKKIMRINSYVIFPRKA